MNSYTILYSLSRPPQSRILQKPILFSEAGFPAPRMGHLLIRLLVTYLQVALLDCVASVGRLGLINERFTCSHHIHSYSTPLCVVLRNLLRTQYISNHASLFQTNDCMKSMYTSSIVYNRRLAPGLKDTWRPRHLVYVTPLVERTLRFMLRVAHTYNAVIVCRINRPKILP